jgi:hypothetical protein
MEKVSYPDISDILARKAEGKRIAAKRSFAEKIAMVEALNARLAPIKAARVARKKVKTGSAAD